MIHVAGGEALPQALLDALGDIDVTSAWVRASGVLEDVRLAPRTGEEEGERLIAGTSHALGLEGALVTRAGKPSLRLRGLFAREGERETLPGELSSARAASFDAIVTVLDAEPAVVVPAARPAAPKPESAWSAAIAASPEPEREPPRRLPASSPAVTPAMIPPRIAVRPMVEDESPIPEAGDVVEHFAFGRCEVLKSDGDRLHLKVGKDSRIREIALEMLKVVSLGETEDGKRRFKLERRL
jgi:hypothetical protein